MEKQGTKDAVLYKGFPLVRCQNELYYGSMDNSHICFIQILKSDKQNDLEIGNKVFVNLLKSDISLPPVERLVKQTSKPSLLSALEIAYVWLSRVLSEEKEK